MKFEIDFLMNISVRGYELSGLDKINILLGKNGCGKSTLLREVKLGVESDSVFGKSSYITPERGGTLSYQANFEQNFYSDKNWITNERRGNQQTSFRQQSASQFSRLERLVLRDYADGVSSEKFDTYVEKINSLLDNIYIKIADVSFKIYSKENHQELNPNQISSGESELISLGIEILSFNKECDLTKSNIIFLDEPDVHLHPDLQVRLMDFLKDLTNSLPNTIVIISTHSAAILGALNDFKDARVFFMQKGDKLISFESISAVFRKILPVFGAHPLTNLFNESPVLILEGEDDERIWQAAVRSSEGKLKAYPCSTGDGVSKIAEFETDVEKIIGAVYEDAAAFSLRDRDDNDEDFSLGDLPHTRRLVLGCRSAENLMLCDEVLASAGKNFAEVKALCDSWIDSQAEHQKFEAMLKFKESGYDRLSFSLKEIRNVIQGVILNQTKPWEVMVGQVIASQSWTDQTDFNREGSIMKFLGEKTVKALLPNAEGE